MIVSVHTPYKPEPNAQGHSERYEVVWPEGMPIPREGETVESKEGTPLRVRSVVWYPHGGAGISEPFVHLVLDTYR